MIFISVLFLFKRTQSLYKLITVKTRGEFIWPGCAIVTPLLTRLTLLCTVFFPACMGNLSHTACDAAQVGADKHECSPCTNLVHTYGSALLTLINEFVLIYPARIPPVLMQPAAFARSNKPTALFAASSKATMAAFRQLTQQQVTAIAQVALLLVLLDAAAAPVLAGSAREEGSKQASKGKAQNSNHGSSNNTYSLESGYLMEVIAEDADIGYADILFYSDAGSSTGPDGKAGAKVHLVALVGDYTSGSHSVARAALDSVVADASKLKKGSFNFEIAVKFNTSSTEGKKTVWKTSNKMLAVDVSWQCDGQFKRQEYRSPRGWFVLQGALTFAACNPAGRIRLADAPLPVNNVFGATYKSAKLSVGV